MLRRRALENLVAEISPAEGNVFAFLRSDHARHGHTPLVGERRVVRATWLRDAGELERKRRRGRLARWLLKGLRPR